MLLLLSACSLDEVPIVEGPHCAPDALGYVVETLDGDTVKVVTASEVDFGGDVVIDDTGDDGGGAAGDGELPVLTVRMLGVDAPEIAHDEGEVADCYGVEAENFTRATLLNRQVILSFDRTCTDAYDRALAYIFLTEETATFDLAGCEAGDCTLPDEADELAAAELLFDDMIIRNGYARVYEDFDNIRLADVLYASQDAAKAKNIGLWATCE